MKIIYFLLALGLINCSTVPSVVYDLWYNYEYSLQKDLYHDFSYYAFRIKTNYLGFMDFEIKILESEYQEFKIWVHEYEHSPDIGSINRNHKSEGYLKGSGSYNEDKYKVYSYSFQAYQKDSYFSIELEVPNYNSFSYMMVRVNSDKYHYSKIKDLNFNTDYPIDTEKFTYTQKRIPYLYQIFIRIGVFDDDEMEIQLTTHEAYDKNTAFKVDVCQYEKKPTEEQVYYGNKAAICQTGLGNESKKEGKYHYPFTTGKGIRYLSISIINQLSNLDYLYIYIYSKKGLAAAIIAVIVIVPAVIIGAVVYFILKKLGICK